MGHAFVMPATPVRFATKSPRPVHRIVPAMEHARMGNAFAADFGQALHATRRSFSARPHCTTAPATACAKPMGMTRVHCGAASARMVFAVMLAIRHVPAVQTIALAMASATGPRVFVIRDSRRRIVLLSHKCVRGIVLERAAV